MLIDIFHDTVCPWCRIGKKHLFDALAQWEEEAVTIRWHPFLLDNTIPSEGYEFRRFMQERKGISSAQLQQMFDDTRQAGEVAGVQLNFDKIRLAVNTQLAHKLIAIAPVKIRNDIVESIYQAYFEDGLNIGDLEVLVAIGKNHQMDENNLRLKLTANHTVDAVMAESTFARLNGIHSVPFFIFNNQVRLDGSQSVNVFLEALNRAKFIEVLTKQW
ncbi:MULTISPECIES: DsbA family oxidoreductase [Cyanophyceae]|uniref:DsbA family oxidoreductase n=1 Tax=Cyanophyceae TaxID=3028117 RepID=UPI00232E409A|nr:MULTISPECIES: DsbA family oxidoreductase [Cyanophyceae]MDB9356196.1 DsbA family oxidoreductase [Nodularia spumigena CS-587/03]MDB9306481.1 DsbA family oxidoreductase [Nodularia spumigena CS-591/12]MDB9318403.1 DsbA family oxidoreductase [Nodularia spumigena CS-590/01A]MDB9320360.1 DsbA family oxidoreductase [Nodularia spumigena CS-591/07A]MDB9327065.1 DsbA family oxidoreductase [Nodularia spumigena CS-590/02]